MDGTYPVILGGEPIGQAVVTTDKLYLCISCRCRLSGEVIYKIRAHCGDHQEDLGVLIPQNGAFCLTKRLPAKRLAGGSLSFSAVPRHPKLEGKLVPLSPETPFSYLTKLENAYLTRQNGQIGIIIRE